MKYLLALSSIAVLGIAASPLSVQAASHSVHVGVVGPAHVFYMKGQSKTGSNPLVTWHGGTIMPSAKVYTIFWGASWPSYSGDKMTGIQSFYQGFGGTKYAATGDEYTGTNGQVTPSVSFTASYIDSSSAAKNPNVSAVVKEVGSVVPTNQLSSDGFYAVYGDLKGSGGFCAWHSYGTVNGVTIQVAWFPNEDGVAGCDPQDGSKLHSQGLASIADSSAHELSEARTDPTNGGWWDNGGQEVGDKCNFIYPVALVTFSNRTQWKIQGEWSNNAYNAGTGYPNGSGQKGCITG